MQRTEPEFERSATEQLAKESGPASGTGLSSFYQSAGQSQIPQSQQTRILSHPWAKEPGERTNQ
jgi:hypothetical protein